MHHYIMPMVMSGHMGKHSKNGADTMKWEAVRKNCRYEGDMEPKCINAFFEASAKNNEIEWWIWFSEFFAAQLAMVFMGLPATVMAPITGIIILSNADLKPDIS